MQTLDEEHEHRTGGATLKTADGTVKTADEFEETADETVKTADETVKTADGTVKTAYEALNDTTGADWRSHFYGVIEQNMKDHGMIFARPGGGPATVADSEASVDAIQTPTHVD